MKQSGITCRALALLLVLAMILPMVPMHGFAVGETRNLGLDLGDGASVSNEDVISWPIKIYDYLNDGMLFEFAQNNTDEATENLYYGGGMPMPFTSDMIGNDYTVASTYRKRSWNKWVSTSASDREAKAEVDTSIVQAVEDESPMFARFTYMRSEDSTVYDPAVNKGTKYRAWINDFEAENGGSLSKERVRYIVLVYRNNEVTNSASINFTFLPDSGDDYTGEDKIIPASTQWTYYIYDMYTDTEAWENLSSVHYVRCMFPLNGIIDGVGETMDLSHVAYFSTMEEAENFGKKAVEFNKDPGHSLAKGYVGGAQIPVMIYGLDFTAEDAYSSSSVSSIVSNDVATVTQRTTGNLRYAYMKGADSWTPDYCTVMDFANDNGGAVIKENVRYAVFVYRSTKLTRTKVEFYLNGGSKGSSQSMPTSSSWTYAVFDLSLGNSAWSSLSTISKVGMYWPGLNSSGDYLDVSHIAFFGTQEDAEAFGSAALAFNANPGVFYGDRTWNMGNNAAFGMLGASGGGGWEDSVLGGENTDPNGYYSYAIGEAITTGWTGINEARNGLKNQVYMLYPNEDYSMSIPEFDGYSLFGTLVAQDRDGNPTNTLFTAGLIQPTLETVSNPDGSVSRRIVYREETVDYIADLLQKTLVIPRFDKNGNPNYNFVRGTAHTQFSVDGSGEAMDLASALRYLLGITFTEGQNKGSTPALGDYASSHGKKDHLIGDFQSCAPYIKTCYDAAYYLLNNIFVKNSYNEAQDDFNYLQLNKVENGDYGGSAAYVFDAGFTNKDGLTAMDYGTDGVLNMRDVENKTEYCYKEGSYTTLYPFTPVMDVNGNSSYPDETYSPYFGDDGVNNVSPHANTYASRNYNYVMATNGEFRYYAEDKLFFEFEGDDDIYLFLNGQLVLDIGGGHSVAMVRFEVDDYVDWAWGIKNDASAYAALSDAEKARVDALALNEGEEVSFDFYYMERHGYGANCRIVTNIRVTDPAMDVEKTAYQDGVRISDGGIINKSDAVEYGFAITNEGDSSLFLLALKDDNIGIALDPTKGLVVTGTQVTDVSGGELTASDLTATITHPDYDPITVTFADNAALIAFLKDGTAAGVQAGLGLFVHSTVEFRGFAYTLTEGDKQAGKFFNTVKAEANTRVEGDGRPMKGEDEMRVFIAAEPLYYQWAGDDHALTISYDMLIEDIMTAADTEGNSLNNMEGVQGITANNVTSIEEVNSGGSLRDNAFVEIEESSIVFHYDTPGSYVCYLRLTYTVSGSSRFSTIPVLVNVADVEDSIFVLDYGLKVNLHDNGELWKKDALMVPARENSFTFLGMSDQDPAPVYVKGLGNNKISFTADGTVTLSNADGYGTYTMGSQSLSYEPTRFMEGRDSIYLAVSVHEKGFTPALGSTDVRKEAQMFKKITVLPANVVYYEDDFAATDQTILPVIHYNENSGNEFTPIGSSSGLTQSPDQDENYGHDDAYSGDSGDYSGGTYHKIKINTPEDIAWFYFTGTGFELVARTNAADSGMIVVKVLDQNDKQVKLIPVITEFDNQAATTPGGSEAIRQVPIIRVDDLAAADGSAQTYKVVISGAPTYDFSSYDGTGASLTVKDTYLYLDGVRIFQPLGNTDVPEYDNENGSQFREIRELILSGEMALAKVEEDTFTVGTALNTWTENRNGEFEGNQVQTPDAYLMAGPNNETYIYGDYVNQALVLYVSEEGSGTHDLQIAMRAVDPLEFMGAGTSAKLDAQVLYGVEDGEGFAWTPLVTLKSGTEQYYTIDYTTCPLVDGKYQVVIYVRSGMVSFSSLKINGLKIQSVGGPVGTVKYDENGNLVKLDGTALEKGEYPRFEPLSRQMRSGRVIMLLTPAPGTDRVPGQTEPAPTEPTGKEPEQTDPTETTPPSEDTKPTEPTAPTDPAEGTKPVEPTAPTDPTEGTKPVEPTAPTAPTESTKPTEPTAPADPSDPEGSKPTDPSEPEDPTDPSVPADPEPENPFVDVKEGKYYYDAVLWAVENGITTGKTETTFEPDEPCTRKQIVTFLWRAAGEPEPESMVNPFVDVKHDRFEKAILWAYYKGITTGTTATTFSPDAPCTRKQIVTFLWRFAGEPEAETKVNPFTDVKADRFENAILWAYENGITTGKTATTFQPEVTCTRCQIVTFLYRAIGEDSL